MFKILEKIKVLLNLHLSWRQTGSTNLLKKIASENDIFVIVASDNEKIDFDGKAISINDLFQNQTIIAFTPKPILIDNELMILLLKDAGNNIDELEREKNRRDASLKRIAKELEEYNFKPAPKSIGRLGRIA